MLISKKHGLGHRLIQLFVLGVYKILVRIDLESSFQKFFLKCALGCRFNIMSQDKKSSIDFGKCRLAKWMKKNMGRISGEMHYASMKLSIICNDF